jgi:hypothetical protein
MAPNPPFLILSLSKDEDRAIADTERSSPFDKLRTRTGRMAPNPPFLILSLSKDEDRAIADTERSSPPKLPWRQAQDEDGKNGAKPSFPHPEPVEG